MPWFALLVVYVTWFACLRVHSNVLTWLSSLAIRVARLSGDWYPGRLTQAETTFQDRGADWAAAGPSWADVWPIAPRQPVTPNASSRPRRNRPTLFINKAFSRLARSWAEMVTGTA